LARRHRGDSPRRSEAPLKNDEPPPDGTTRAHLEECPERIAQVLAASVQVNEP
jgi:hypothetical protein